MGLVILILSLLLNNFEADFECLTEAIYFEAGSQNMNAKLAVGHVIENRVNDNMWPDSYCAVVRQKKQFSYYWDGKPERMPIIDNYHENIAVSQSQWAAMIILALSLDDETNGSTLYHSDKPPGWWDYEKIEAVAYAGDFKLYRYRSK